MLLQPKFILFKICSYVLDYRSASKILLCHNYCQDIQNLCNLRVCKKMAKIVLDYMQKNIYVVFNKNVDFEFMMSFEKIIYLDNSNFTGYVSNATRFYSFGITMPDMPNLEKLHISELNTNKKFPNLKSLNIKCGNLRQICEQCPKLEILKITENFEDIPEIIFVKKLLAISNSRIKISGYFPNLTSLYAGIYVGVENIECPKLVELSVNRYTAINVKTLQSLSIRGYDHQEIKESFPELEKLNIKNYKYRLNNDLFPKLKKLIISGKVDNVFENIKMPFIYLSMAIVSKPIHINCDMLALIHTKVETPININAKIVVTDNIYCFNTNNAEYLYCTELIVEHIFPNLKKHVLCSINELYGIIYRNFK